MSAYETADSDDPFEPVNKGPNGGGMYSNDDNVLSDSGYTCATEATSVSGALMGDMPSQDNRGTIGGSQTQISDSTMAGGNA